MLALLTLLTACYTVVVWRVLRAKRQARVADAALLSAGLLGQVLAELPEEDRPPGSAVGWPPGGARFGAYVHDGFVALDAYLSEDYPT